MCSAAAIQETSDYTCSQNGNYFLLWYIYTHITGFFSLAPPSILPVLCFPRPPSLNPSPIPPPLPPSSLYSPSLSGILSDVLNYVLKHGKSASTMVATEQKKAEDGVTPREKPLVFNNEVFVKCFQFLKALAAKNLEVQQR